MCATLGTTGACAFDDLNEVILYIFIDSNHFKITPPGIKCLLQTEDGLRERINNDWNTQLA